MIVIRDKRQTWLGWSWIWSTEYIHVLRVDFEGMQMERKTDTCLRRVHLWRFSTLHEKK
jgi:hypothetical protein